MSEITDGHLPEDSPGKPAGPVFGFEEFWAKVYGRYKPQFDAIIGLVSLGDEMVRAADVAAAEPVNKVVSALTRATITGACEAVALCGNGFGSGAMKVVRGMYESRWTAEYLRRHPEKVEDYLEFSKVLSWRRFRWLQENAPSEASRIPAKEARRVKTEYDQAKPRFTGHKGHVRVRWSKESIRDIAQDVGCEREFELPYGIACSIHHGDFGALSALFELKDGTITPDPPPSPALVRLALVCAHANLGCALNTLNIACGLDFADKLNAAQKHFSETWEGQRACAGRNSEPTRRD